MPSTLFRVQDWLADRFTWVQYPRQQLLPGKAKPPFFKHAMPWPLRGLLVLFGVLAIGAAAAALFFVGVFFWALVTA